MATELKSLKGAKLKNTILSSNPCPSCLRATDQQPMTKTAWRNSPFGLTDSSKRYCNLKANNCHCILVPEQMMKDLPDIGERVPLRGDRRGDLRGIIEIGPNEMELQLLMEEYNFTIGQLPTEIYDMPLEEVADYLRGLLGGTPVVPPIVPAVPPPTMATVEKAQKYLWDEMEKDGREMGVMYSRDGKYVLSRKGTRHSIQWTPAEVEKSRGGYMWHSHPHDTAFSWDDMNFAANANLKEMGVVGERHLYTLKPRTTWGDVNTYAVKYGYNRKKAELRIKYMPYYNRLIAQGVNSQEAVYRANHYAFLDLWNYLAREYGMIFTSKRKGF